MSSEQMNESSYDDDDKGEYFCGRKRVRHSGNPSEKKNSTSIKHNLWRTIGV